MSDPERPVGLAQRLRRWVAGRDTTDRRDRPVRGGVPSVLVLNAPDALCHDLEDALCEALPDARVTVLSALPAEAHRRGAQRWLDDHAATVALWVGALPTGPLLSGLTASETAVLAADVPIPPATDIARPRDRRAMRAALGRFRVTFAHDAEAARRLRLLAPAGARVEPLGPLTPLPRPPHCSIAERDELAQCLQARPVWLAAFPEKAELAAILTAHRTALRGAHRLLLVIAPEDERDGATIAGDLRSEGWRVARRGAEAEPGDTDEIFIADIPEEIGLWYRLVPITLLGGTLLDGGRIADPMGAATLGSAVIVGPAAGVGIGVEDARDAMRGNGQPIGAPSDQRFDEVLSRLAAAGGLCRIDRPEDLALAVSDLLAPDKAAAHAHAAWDVASDGARVLDRVVAEVRVAARAAAV